MPSVISHIILRIALSKTGDPFSWTIPLRTEVFLIVGDPFLRTQKAKVLVSEIEKNVGEPLAQQTFDLDETPLEIVLAAAKTLPFLSSGQVIYAQGAGSLKEPDLEVLAAYLGNPAPKTTLILESDDLKGTSELQKLIKAKGQLILLARDEARGAGAIFIQQKLEQYHKTMAFGAKARILAMCGDAMIFLDTILERLVQFSGDRQEIDEDMVNRFEENWTEMDVFKLTNALVDRDPARALKVFRDLMEFYEAYLFSLVGILHWQLRQLWQAAMLLTSGVSEREIGSKLRMSPSRLSALRRFPVECLESAVEALYQIDLKSKSGQLEGISGLEAWLLEYTAL
jgi:DNA polymerase III subunit delta